MEFTNYYFHFTMIRYFKVNAKMLHSVEIGRFIGEFRPFFQVLILMLINEPSTSPIRGPV